MNSYLKRELLTVFILCRVKESRRYCGKTSGHVMLQQDYICKGERGRTFNFGLALRFIPTLLFLLWRQPGVTLSLRHTLFFKICISVARPLSCFVCRLHFLVQSASGSVLLLWHYRSYYSVTPHLLPPVSLISSLCLQEMWFPVTLLTW
jgi:hypothetical protein